MNMGWSQQTGFEMDSKNKNGGYGWKTVGVRPAEMVNLEIQLRRMDIWQTNMSMSTS